jgi:ABC-type cobalamin/Fe3+-siderophores transport system ATPase subunit
MSVLEARSLTHRINETYCIQDITLEFLPGVLYGILGPNGSGKSSLLKTLSGIWKPTSGYVLWQGDDLLQKERDEISQTISVVPQNPQTRFDFTVLDFVLMGRYPHQGKPTAQVEELVKHSLKMVNGWYLRERPITSLSSGERQRVYIARALVTESPVLMLDEPTASLDIRHQLEIWRLLKLLVKEGKMVLVTIHDLPATARFCDQVVVLDRGKHVAKGKFSEVMRPPLLREVFGVIENLHPYPMSFDLPS